MKLFNTLRFKLIEGKRLKKYLLYAIGEIILVVIGILVAVTINNYNENKKAEKECVKIAKQIQQKLASDIAKIKETRQEISENLELYNLYLKKDKTEAERLTIVAQAPFLVTIGIQFLPVNLIVSSSLNKVASQNTTLANKLMEIEQDYIVVDKTLRPMEDIMKDELIKNINHIKENFSWYEKLVGNNGKFTVEEYKYFGSDDYKNRVVHMRFLYVNGYDSILEEVEQIYETHLEELNELLKDQ
ncbi:hypothetical protein HNV08_08380 [Winogradskyella eckloniae]|uniref:DUF6090 family protein n=1 Tax=Winogradskyella eckloniae TaxID=1089306 RepID=UPI0015639903|nr:DUF6090 family protein [Winogradskyella eckloniae]NRD20063.1 hypothetical protein [Winogradskyella eckloniae]